MQGHDSFREGFHPPTWSLTDNDLPRGEKRSWDEDSSRSTSAKRGCGGLTFLPETFRPLINLWDEQDFGPFSSSRTHHHETSTLSRQVPVVDEQASVPTKSSLPPSCTKYVWLPQVSRGDSSQAFDRTYNSDIGATKSADTKSQTSRATDHNGARFREPGRPHGSSYLPNLGSNVLGEFCSSTNSSCGVQKPHVAIKTPKTPNNTLSREDRKRYFIEKSTAQMVEAMKKWIAKSYMILDSQRSNGECWLHPKPPLLNSQTGRPRGSIRHTFKWKDQNSLHSQSLSVNFGVVALLVESFLTEEQKEGFIQKTWHLSHLCGNWTCLNWRHLTVEDGSINVQRNACFMHRNGCLHNPPCMKQLKRRLSFATSPPSEAPLPREVPAAPEGKIAQKGDKIKPILLSYPSKILPMPYAQPEEMAQESDERELLLLSYPLRILPMPYIQPEFDMVF
ncbi:hypothetical protein MMC27_000947 [Xylographa pallens]|nr:hypothetical protein [Xylographa pallens]